jgi:hypothetical protein
MSIEAPEAAELRDRLTREAALLGIPGREIALWEGFIAQGQENSPSNSTYLLEALSFLEATSQPEGGILVKPIADGVGNIQFVKINHLEKPLLRNYFGVSQDAVDWRVTAQAYPGKRFTPLGVAHTSPDWRIVYSPTAKKLVSVVMLVDQGIILPPKILSRAVYRTNWLGNLALDNVTFVCPTTSSIKRLITVDIHRRLGYLQRALPGPQGAVIHEGQFQIGHEHSLPADGITLRTKGLKTKVTTVRVDITNDSQTNETVVALTLSDHLTPTYNLKARLTRSLPKPNDLRIQTLVNPRPWALLGNSELANALNKWVEARACLEPHFAQTVYKM